MDSGLVNSSLWGLLTPFHVAFSSVNPVRVTVCIALHQSHRITTLDVNLLQGIAQECLLIDLLEILFLELPVRQGMIHIGLVHLLSGEDEIS